MIFCALPGGIMHTEWPFRRVAFLALSLILLNAVYSNGQSQITTGTIQGTVSDQTGAVVPNVTVVLKNASTGVERTVTTDEAGRYTAPLLQVGDYEISAEAPGFSKVTRK